MLHWARKVIQVSHEGVLMITDNRIFYFLLNSSVIISQRPTSQSYCQNHMVYVPVGCKFWVKCTFLSKSYWISCLSSHSGQGAIYQLSVATELQMCNSIWEIKLWGTHPLPSESFPVLFKTALAMGVHLSTQSTISTLTVAFEGWHLCHLYLLSAWTGS